MDKDVIDWLLHDIDDFQIELGKAFLGKFNSIYHETKSILHRLSEGLVREDWLEIIITWSQLNSIYVILTDYCIKENQLNEIRDRLGNIIELLGNHINLSI